MVSGFTMVTWLYRFWSASKCSLPGGPACWNSTAPPLPFSQEAERKQEEVITAKYVPILEEMAKARNAVFRTVHIQTREDAQNAPSPFTTFSLFYDRQLVTHEILSEKKFDKILADKGV